MKKFAFIVGMLLLMFSCKQNKQGVVKEILKINSISVDGKNLSVEELKNGSAQIECKDRQFVFVVDAEIANVKALFQVGSRERDITENVINRLPFIAEIDKDAKCKLTFIGAVLGTIEYRFEVHKVSKNEMQTPHLTFLKIGEKEITASEIKDEMSVSFSSLTERLPVEYKTDSECIVKFLPGLEEGMLISPFGRTTDVYINLEGKEKKNYKLSLYIENGNVTSHDLALTFLKVNGGEIKPVEEVTKVNLAYDAPYNIAIEALANNGVVPRFVPELQNGKIGVGFNEGVKEVKIYLEKKGFASRTYSVVVEREEEKPTLKSLTVNGHAVQIADEMNVHTSYSKDNVLIMAVGRFGTNVRFDPPLVNDAMAIAEGATKKVEIIVEKDGLTPRKYTLNVIRDVRPTDPRPSRVESVMIASGLDATANFEDLSPQFPNEADAVKYAIILTEYTLKVERLNPSDNIVLKKIVRTKVNDKEDIKEEEVSATNTVGATSFYNIVIKDRDTNKSSIDEFKLVMEENGMLKKEVTFSLCFEGAYAQAFRRPQATIGDVSFEPLLTKMNYLSKSGRLNFRLVAFDPLSKVTQENGNDFSNFSIEVSDDSVVQVPFILTTCTGREVKSSVSFKMASGKERCLLEYLKFYPEKPDINNGNFLMYSNLPSPRFRPEDNKYKLELNPGDWELFFDCNAVIKEAEMTVSVDGVEVTKSEYYKDKNGVINLYKLEVLPNEIKTIEIKLTSDIDSSIENIYKIDVIAPDDGSVATFEASFHDSNGVEMKTLPAISKKDRGIRLPPQDLTGGEIKMELKAKSDGVKFIAQQWVIEFNSQGKAQIKEKYELKLDEENRAVIRTGVGMTFIAVQALARNGFSKETKVYEIYRFNKTNKVFFEIGAKTTAGTLTRIEMDHWQKIITVSASAPLTFKGHIGSETDGKFALATYEDYQASKPFKSIDSGDHREFTIPNNPRIIIVGVVMPDNATLYYALFLK